MGAICERIIYSSLSTSRSGLGELAQLVPRHFPKAGEQVSPAFNMYNAY